MKWLVQKQGDIDGHGRQFFDSDPAVQRMAFVSFLLCFKSYFKHWIVEIIFVLMTYFFMWSNFVFIILLVQLGCHAFGEYGPNPQNSDLKMFKDLSHKVISVCNATAHCETLEALERMVCGCRLAITKWPELELKYLAQVKIISQYSKFKLLLPNSFQ